MALRPANPVIGDCKSPVRSSQIVSYDYSGVAPVLGKRMLERIDDELRYDEPNAYSLTGRGGAAFDVHLQGDRSTVALGSEGWRCCCTVAIDITRWWAS